MNKYIKNKNFSILLIDNSKYYEKYLALRKWINNKNEDIISFGKNLSKVIKESNEKGFTNPIILYVPNPEKYFILNNHEFS